LIIAKTEIGRGIPEVAGTAKGHGEGGANFAESARKGLGLPEETFFVSDTVREYFAQHGKQLAETRTSWKATFDAWSNANAELAKQLQAALEQTLPSDLLEQIPYFAEDAKLATRAAGGEVLQPLAKAVPSFIGGSADLFGSTKNYLKDAGDFSKDHPEGRNLWFGIREHAMGAILNGLAYDGIFRPSGATFAVFADYLRPSIRLAALAKLPVLYIFTHDSVGVGEDGPTHQPVETCSGLRVIPGLDVIRPADPEETAGALVAGLQKKDGPTLLLLTRQGVPMLNAVSADTRREGAAKGGYILVKETAPLETILIASGSEVQHAVAAASELGAGTRVVSMPSMERFDRQSAAYRADVLPPECRRRVAIEAGVTGLWWKYVGENGQVVGIDRFGISAPGGTAMQELGISAEALVSAARALG
jgi:transketolase